ncbi:MAG: hypothetical protein ACRDL7_07570, partial [Gaiellaceae bacterium]
MAIPQLVELRQAQLAQAQRLLKRQHTQRTLRGTLGINSTRYYIVRPTRLEKMVRQLSEALLDLRCTRQDLADPTVYPRARRRCKLGVER